MLGEVKFEIRICDLDVLQRQLSEAGSPFLALEVSGPRSHPVCSIFDIAEKPLDIAVFDVVGEEVPSNNVYGQRVAKMLAEAVIAQGVFFVEFERGRELHGLSSLIKDNDSVSVLMHNGPMSYEENEAD